MSTLSDHLYQEVMANPPMCRVSLRLTGGHVLTGDMHVPPMPANTADPFPIYLLAASERSGDGSGTLTMVDPAAIEAYAVTPSVDP